ncbi:hypothetical protein H9P43_007292 [Blastocladiella emersonii ATCC 22665]|nr:hypothetical protein H9P43_007292 [Blastocladiella emersonii ATCC 22665]
MFGGDWADSAAAKEPIALPAWQRAAFALAIVNLYTGWVPGPDAAPKPITAAFAKLEVKLAELYHYDVLVNCLDLAEMLECPKLMTALKPKIVDAISTRINAISIKPAA